jgi:hypothetical protein
LDYNLLRRQLANIDAVVTVSDFVTDRARARFPGYAAAIHTIGNGVDVGRFLPDPNRDGALAPAEKPRLLFVGRISPDKGVHLLIEAFERVARERPDIELTLIGKVGMLPFDLVSLLLSDDPDALDSLRPFYGRSTLAWLTKEVFGQKRSYKQQSGSAPVARGCGTRAIHQQRLAGRIDPALRPVGPVGAALDLARVVRTAGGRVHGERCPGARSRLRRRTGTGGCRRDGPVGPTPGRRYPDARDARHAV